MMTTISDHVGWPIGGDATPLEGQVPSTDLLVGRCLSGDTTAYAHLYQLHATYIYRLTYGLLRHKEDAEEVLQDTFEYAFRRLDQFDPHKSAFKSWIYRIAVSRCRNKRRRKWLPTFSLQQHDSETGEQREIEIQDHEAPAPEELLELSVRQALVWDALGMLSDKLRETAILRYYEGLSYQEIGSILGISSKTAESRMRLAHRALKSQLDGKL